MQETRESEDYDTRFRAALGQRVREAREAKGLSQYDLGQTSGVRPAHISAIERGASNVSDEKRQKLADALDIDVRELVYGPAVASR